MTRNRAIDRFRGLAIVTMVFFTVILKLSRDLPDPLRHNVHDSFHIGDVVLPLFLFASGLSLAYYLDKVRYDNKEKFLRDILIRFGKLALLGALLSPISANGFLQMDEVMLSGLLFLLCTGLSFLSWKTNLGIILGINSSYLVLTQLVGSGIFDNHYLGGYPAAPFYLPVMLSGLLIGKEMISNGLWSMNNKVTIGVLAVFFLVSWFFTPLRKMEAAPSYMMLSVLICWLVFVLTDKLSSSKGSPGELEYLGRKPLRFWLMMFLMIIIPLKLYTAYVGKNLPLDFHWPVGLMLGIGMLLALWLVSKFYDHGVRLQNVIHD